MKDSPWLCEDHPLKIVNFWIHLNLVTSVKSPENFQNDLVEIKLYERWTTDIFLRTNRIDRCPSIDNLQPNLGLSGTTPVSTNYHLVPDGFNLLAFSQYLQATSGVQNPSAQWSVNCAILGMKQMSGLGCPELQCSLQSQQNHYFNHERVTFSIHFTNMHRNFGYFRPVE